MKTVIPTSGCFHGPRVCCALSIAGTMGSQAEPSRDTAPNDRLAGQHSHSQVSVRRGRRDSLLCNSALKHVAQSRPAQPRENRATESKR